MVVKAIPEQVGKRYELLERLGAGGMGVVYKALDRLTDQYVALKRVRLSNTVQSAEVDTRLALAQEFQVLASLRHPHIITVLDFGFDDSGNPYVVMDLLDKPENLLTSGYGLPLNGRVGLLVQILQALTYMHRRGILHRDLKPGNIMVVQQQVRILDFGLAMLTGNPTNDPGLVGTPAYIAPELFQGEPASQASDLYAVGVMAYELLAGRHPFHTDNISRLIMQVIHDEPDMTPLTVNVSQLVPPSLPEDMSTPSAASGDGDTTRIHDPGQTAKTAKPDDETTQLNIAARPPHAVTTRVHNPQFSMDTDSILSDLGMDVDTPSVNPLVDVVQRLLNKNPARRYQNTIDVITDLNKALGLPLPAETTAMRDSFLQAAHFVGRDHEIRILLKALEEAKTGAGSAWLIAGESGVGKSRLLNELRTRALVMGITVLRGQAVANVGQPYNVWHDPMQRLVLATELSDADASALQTLIPDVGRLLGRPVDQTDVDPDQTQRRLANVIANVFHRQKGPILLILEDLHWAGSESLALLRKMSQFASKLPLLILGSFRDDERPDLPKQLTEMEPLKLGRLSSTQIEALSQSMLGEVGREPRVLDLLQRETEGNVYFMVEVLRALAEEAGRLDRISTMTLPAQVFTGGVARIVKRRLDRLPEDARPLLTLAAILGREVNLAVLQAATPDADLDNWLSVCASAAVLDVQDEHWQFTHHRLREGLLEGIPDEDRPELHRKAALALEAVAPDQVAALAYHWEQVGDSAKVITYATRAGQQANQISAFGDALAYLNKALALLPAESANDPARADLLVLLGEIYMRQNNHAEATRILDSGLEIAKRLGDIGLQARALFNLGNVVRSQGKVDLAAEHYEQSLALSRRVGTSAQRTAANALRGLARIAASQGKYDVASQHLSESLALSRETGDRWMIAQVLNGLGVVATQQGRLDSAINYLTEGISVFKALGDRRGIANALLDIGQLAFNQGKVEAGIHHLEESLNIARAIDDSWIVAASLNNLGYMMMQRGEYPRANAYLSESLASFRGFGDKASVAQTLVNLGHVATALGDDPGAEADFREAISIGLGMKAAPLLLEAISGMARLRANAGELEDAARLATFALKHSGANSDVKSIAEPLLLELRARLPQSVIENATNQAANLTLEAAAQGLIEVRS